MPNRIGLEVIYQIEDRLSGYDNKSGVEAHVAVCIHLPNPAGDCD